MTTRCKFECVSVRKSKFWGEVKYVYEYEFNVVIGGSEENKAFFASTPTGKLTFQAVKDSLFEPGQLVYLDISNV